jgi:hypothetical protein
MKAIFTLLTYVAAVFGLILGGQWLLGRLGIIDTPREVEIVRGPNDLDVLEGRGYELDETSLHKAILAGDETAIDIMRRYGITFTQRSCATITGRYQTKAQLDRLFTEFDNAAELTCELFFNMKRSMKPEDAFGTLSDFLVAGEISGLRWDRESSTVGKLSERDRLVLQELSSRNIRLRYFKPVMTDARRQFAYLAREVDKAGSAREVGIKACRRKERLEVIDNVVRGDETERCLPRPAGMSNDFAMSLGSVRASSGQKCAFGSEYKPVTRSQCADIDITERYDAARARFAEWDAYLAPYY